ncbi:unnamed protein product [Adineta steineri]|uniref:Uncharacterized protein n=1 Tax=Adineta steineri TaxID=433720 RepID=A0A813SZX8_9BILA|nr:unnamed protein product [Adineta steineri]CAF4178778.1 unnamed protein product [Adineta steineri]
MLNRNPSCIEDLANELWLDMFDYLDWINLYSAFYGINKRINQLLEYTLLMFYNIAKYFRSFPSLISLVIDANSDDYDRYTNQHCPFLQYLHLPGHTFDKPLPINEHIMIHENTLFNPLSSDDAISCPAILGLE